MSAGREDGKVDGVLELTVFVAVSLGSIDWASASVSLVRMSSSRPCQYEHSPSV
jgi:hypothetical protein